MVLHRSHFVTFGFLLSALVMPALVRAREGDAAQRDFVARYVAALTSQDGERLRSLHHPASLACIGAENRDYYDFIFGKELSRAAELRGGYTLTRFAPVDAETAAMSEMGGMVPNPVKPTHQFQIDTPFDSNNHSLMILRMAVQHNEAWFIVLGCPTAQAVAFFRARRAEGERQQARARQLAADVREPLLSEIKALLVEKRRIDAVKRFKDSAAVDLTTATQVIDVLAAQ
jgi:hypothetical protein